MTTSFGKTLRLASLFDPDTGAPELPSPALMVDLGRFEANVAAAEDWFSGTGKKIRPHVKAHRGAGSSCAGVRGGRFARCGDRARRGSMRGSLDGRRAGRRGRRPRPVRGGRTGGGNRARR